MINFLWNYSHRISEATKESEADPTGDQKKFRRIKILNRSCRSCRQNWTDRKSVSFPDNYFEIDKVQPIDDKKSAHVTLYILKFILAYWHRDHSCTLFLDFCLFNSSSNKNVLYARALKCSFKYGSGQSNWVNSVAESIALQIAYVKPQAPEYIHYRKQKLSPGLVKSKLYSDISFSYSSIRYAYCHRELLGVKYQLFFINPWGLSKGVNKNMKNLNQLSRKNEKFYIKIT